MRRGSNCPASSRKPERAPRVPARAHRRPLDRCPLLADSSAAFPEFAALPEAELAGDLERALAELRAAPASGAGAYDVATTEAWIFRVAGRFEEADRSE